MKYVQTAAGHAVAATVVVTATVVFTVVAYFVLLAWAIVADEGLGGPLALPFLMLAGFVLSVVSTAVVLFPATLLGHLIVELRGWPTLVEIPVATALSIVIVGAIGAVVGWLRGDVAQGMQLTLISWGFLLLPLGVYWWCLQGTALLIRLCHRAWCRITGAESVVGGGA